MNTRTAKKNSIIFLVVLAVVIAAGLIYRVRQQEDVQSTDTQVGFLSPEEVTEPVETESQDNKQEAEIKPSVLLPVPFTPQAPSANWDELHNEACEEASVLMADAYFKGNHASKLSVAYAEGEISKLTEWQKKNLGYNLSITTEEAARMTEEVYGLKTKLIRDYTEDDMKRELSEGRLVILPANGRLLGNPNFKSPGPIYHMLVIKGYDGSSFITNDPGTRNGMSYKYKFSTLYAASGDYEHDNHEVNRDKKVLLIVWK